MLLRELFDRIGLFPTNYFVTTASTRHTSRALLTDCWGVAHRAAADCAAQLDAERTPPRDFHALGERQIWRMQLPDIGASIGIGRVFRSGRRTAEASPWEISVITHRSDCPVAYLASDGSSTSKMDESELMRRLAPRFGRRYLPTEDVRNRWPRTQDPSLIRFGEILNRPLLDSGAAERLQPPDRSKLAGAVG